MGPKASGFGLSPHLIRHHSTGATRLFGTPTISTRVLSYQYEELLGATQGSDTETLWSLLFLRYLQLYSTIPAIHGSRYTARSSPRSKHYNAPISMRAIIDSCGYICIGIPTIKQHNLDGYKKIITYEIYNYVDPKDPHPRRQLRRV